MDIKGRENKLHRVNPNGVMCSKSDLAKLKAGLTVTMDKKVAQELLDMGVVEQVTKQKKKKEAK
jgi:hypothetical protein